MATREARQIGGTVTTNGTITTRALLGKYAYSVERLVSSRGLMGALTCVACILYLWNAPHAIDYPTFDEATYYARAYALLHGNLATAQITDPGTSPVYIFYCAFWLLILHSSLIFPWVSASSLFLIGIGAYLLLSRLLPPFLSFLLACATLVFAAPAVPNNACFYFGTGILWISLSLIGSHILQRGLTVLGTLLATLVRPEFAIVLLALVVCLAVYEWRQWRRGAGSVLEWRMVATSYGPLVFGLAFVGILVLTMPPLGYDRVAQAVPWSYNDWYAHIGSPLFQGGYSFNHVWIIFEHDFGPVPSHTLSATLLAMLHNPPKLVGYLIFEFGMLVASFYTAFIQSWGYRYASGGTGLFIGITQQDTWQFGLYIAAFVALVLLFIGIARVRGNATARGNAPANGARRDLLTWIVMACLATVVVWLLLVLSYYRFYEVYPVVFLGLGYGITRIAAVLKPPVVIAPLVIVVVLVGMPHPYAGNPVRPIASSLALVRAYVPSGSGLATVASDTYLNFLQSDNYDLLPVEPSVYAAPILANAWAANPRLDYTLDVGSVSQFQSWDAGWSQQFPGTQWDLVASQSSPEMYLYTLSPESQARLTYLELTRGGLAPGVAATLPPYSAVDFSTNGNWQVTDSHNVLVHMFWTAWNANVNALVMHPGGVGVDPTVPHDVTMQVPPQWSGKQLIFAATLAPWAANQSQAQGVQFTVSVPGLHVSQTTEILNSYPKEFWTPIFVQLPTYTGTQTLDVHINQRVSIVDDTSLFTFLGVTSSTTHPATQPTATPATAPGGNG